MNKNNDGIEREYVYNGLPSVLMNLICKYLSQRMELENIKDWDMLSLYLARTCGVIEDKFYIIPKTDAIENHAQVIYREPEGFMPTWRDKK